MKKEKPHNIDYVVLKLRCIKISNTFTYNYH